jgi:hypothetical protein
LKRSSNGHFDALGKIATGGHGRSKWKTHQAHNLQALQTTAEYFTSVCGGHPFGCPAKSGRVNPKIHENHPLVGFLNPDKAAISLRPVFGIIQGPKKMLLSSRTAAPLMWTVFS